MSATLYGILYESNASKSDLRRILDSPAVSRQGHLYDGQALYAALCREFDWEEPLPGSHEDVYGINIWSQDYPDIIPVTVPEGYLAGGLFLIWDETQPDPDAAVILDLKGSRDTEASSEILQILFEHIPQEWFSMETSLELSSFYNDRKDQGMHECQCGVELPAASLREILNRIRDNISGEYPGFGILNDNGKWSAGFNEEYRTAFISWKENNTDRCFGFEICTTD